MNSFLLVLILKSCLITFFEKYYLKETARKSEVKANIPYFLNLYQMLKLYLSDIITRCCQDFQGMNRILAYFHYHFSIMGLLDDIIWISRIWVLLTWYLNVDNSYAVITMALNIFEGLIVIHNARPSLTRYNFFPFFFFFFYFYFDP